MGAFNARWALFSLKRLFMHVMFVVLALSLGLTLTLTRFLALTLALTLALSLALTLALSLGLTLTVTLISSLPGYSSMMTLFTLLIQNNWHVVPLLSAWGASVIGM